MFLIFLIFNSFQSYLIVLIINDKNKQVPIYKAIYFSGYRKKYFKILPRTLTLINRLDISLVKGINPY